MSVTPSPIGGFAAQFFDNNGVILSGGKIYTYAAGTTTPQASYTSASGATPHANPIILDSAGRVPGGEIWLTDGLVYKFVIETATSILLGTYDNITGVNSNFVNYTIQEEVITATAGQTVFNLSTINYTPGTNSLSVYIDGVNQYVGDSYIETDSDTVTFTSGVHVGGEVKFTTAIQTTTAALPATAVSFTGFKGQLGSVQDLADSDGSDWIGFNQSGTGAVARSAQDKMRDIRSVLDFGADNTGVVDCTAAFQSAITSGSVFFPAGTYTMSWTSISADISIPANRKIEIQKGATVTMTGGRFTAENVDDVEWQIDGWLKSVAMRTAASKPLWTASADERGFIEFAENYVAGSAASGFTVHGTGKVSGDWVGTPNVSSLFPFQVNRKGIACWNSKNVLVNGLEIFGFDGEAVYASFFDAASENIVFSNNNVHDTRFNSLNFNAGANGGNVKICNNRAVDTYQLEASVGEITDNYIDTTTSYGIFTGAGVGAGPMVIKRNTVKSAGISAIAAINAAGSPSIGLDVCDNTIIDSGQYAILIDYFNEVTVRGNSCVGSGTTAGAYDIGLTNVLRATVSENTFMEPGAFAQSGRVTADPANCFDVSVCPITNVYKATTGSATPTTGNGVQTLASATALLVPTLGDIFSVTGTTTITSIAPSAVNSNFNGRKITLIFAGALTFTDGGNLKLAGNFVTTADDTITLVCNGTNWFELCRSVN